LENVVKLLEERGPVSAYHEYFYEAQGEESRRTISLNRRDDKPYHIDYIFIPREWAVHLQAVKVGEYKEWSKLSDHCPIVVELEIVDDGICGNVQAG
jgi:endonuclease/exonuclease/phosphatase family metal-dependent hydrolase